MNAFELRELCIIHKWFTRGTNYQYEKLFLMLDEMHPVRDMAVVIWLCSDNVSIEDANKILLDNMKGQK